MSSYKSTLDKMQYKKITNQIMMDTVEDKYITSNITLTDSEGKLKLYHYINCDNYSDETVKNSRGIIRDGETIICKTFGFTPEITTTDNDLYSYISSFNQSKIYLSEEGATIRLFFYGNRWYVSTHRKLDAFRSRWGSPQSKNFGDMFIDALEWQVLNGQLKNKIIYEDRKDLLIRFCDTLDTEKIYTFLVRNSSYNRIVCTESNHPQLYFIGSFDRNTHLLLEGNDSGIDTPELLNFETPEQMIDFVNNIDYTRHQGVILYMPNQKQVKILNPSYYEYFNVRGNEPSIKFRYLQVRKDRDVVSMLYKLYPDYIETFEIYESILRELVFKIYRAYIDRFINHKYISLPQSEYIIMQICHEWHKQDRINNKISIEKVLDVINNQNPTTLNRMIKPYIRISVAVESVNDESIDESMTDEQLDVDRQNKH